MYDQPDWLLVGERVVPAVVFRIFSPQLRADESVTKFLRPLSLRCQCRRRLSLLRIRLRGKIVGVILCSLGIVMPVS